MRMLAGVIALAFGILGLYALVDRGGGSSGVGPPPAPLVGSGARPWPVFYGEVGEVEFLLRPFRVEKGRRVLQARVWNAALDGTSEFQFFRLVVANRGTEPGVLPGPALRALKGIGANNPWEVRLAEDLETQVEHLRVRWRALACRDREEIPPGHLRAYLRAVRGAPPGAGWAGLRVAPSLGEVWAPRGLLPEDLERIESGSAGRWGPRLRPRTKAGKLVGEGGPSSGDEGDQPYETGSDR